jgi:hypothetical protein
MRATQFTTEAAIGTSPKRPARDGSRPERGHEPQKRYVTDRKTGKQYDPDEEFEKKMNSPEVMAQMKRMAQKESIESMEAELEEAKAPRALCKSSTPDEDLGASQLASCKSQGLRARDGEKSHKLGKSSKSRVKVGGKRIKGSKYGGPLPDWS